MKAHGTISRYTNNRCRCLPCRAANTAYYYRRRSLAGTLARHGPRLPRHGTRPEYTRKGCRCDLCRAAETAYRTNYRAQRKEQT